MAKYHGSVIGTISGKLGNLVFTTRKGIRVVYLLPENPKNRATSQLVRKYLQGKDQQGKLSIKIVNMRLSFATVGYIYTHKLSPFIKKAWETICCKKRLPMSAHCLFLKYNQSELYHSIPNRDKLCGPDNMPDLSQLQITEGDLYEPTIMKNATYNPQTGKLKVIWDSKVYCQGSPDDTAHILALYWKLPEPTADTYDPRPWESIKLWGSNINQVAKRSDGKAQLIIDKTLDPKYLIVYLFFSNKDTYSPSASVRPSEY